MTRSPTSAEFSVLVLITFLLKIDILGLAMLILLDADEAQEPSKISSSTVVDLCFFCMSLMILSWTKPTLESLCILLCYFSNKTTYWWYIDIYDDIYLWHILDFMKLKILCCSRLKYIVVHISLETSVQPYWKNYFSVRRGTITNLTNHYMLWKENMTSYKHLAFVKANACIYE